VTGKAWRGLPWFLTCVVLLVVTSGCSLNTVLGPPPQAPSAGAGQQPGLARVNESLVGIEVLHFFSPPENQVDFTMLPSAGQPYIDATGRAGPLDTAPGDPTIKSLNIVCNNFTPNDVVTVFLYDPQGAIAGKVTVSQTGTIDVSTYNAASFRLTATSTGAPVPAPAPYAYLYQMTNSAGTTFTYSVPSPP